jgi:hypothetical protein
MAQEIFVRKILYNFIYKFLLPHRGAGNPEDEAPISVSCVSGSSLPLNSGKYDASVYGQWTAGEPLYMGV